MCSIQSNNFDGNQHQSNPNKLTPIVSCKTIGCSSILPQPLWQQGRTRAHLILNLYRNSHKIVYLKHWVWLHIVSKEKQCYIKYFCISRLSNTPQQAKHIVLNLSCTPLLPSIWWNLCWDFGNIYFFPKSNFNTGNVGTTSPMKCT